ncbi:MAG TPA: hypothetical protein VK506_09940 [Conexibacter sp.]|nr:hypothetical protein [Conexibacter sp.]
MTRKGWLPVTTFPELEEMRQRHEALIDMRRRQQAQVVALRRRFDQEDEAKGEALRDGYRDGKKPKLPQVTTPEERDRLLREAKEHAEAAAEVALDYAYEVRERLRGPLPDGWQPHIALQQFAVPPNGIGAALMGELRDLEATIQARAQEAQRILEEAGHELRTLHPLKHWIAANANGAQGQILPGTDFEVPPTHTPGSKPRDLHVPGWWPTDDPGAGVEQPIAEIKPDEDGTVDLSDPWFKERDAESVARKEL